MKKYLLILIATLSFSQNKTIVPSSGKIVFEKKEVIIDTLLFKKSYEKVLADSFTLAKKEVLAERGYANNQIPDSVNFQIDQSFAMLKLFILKEITSGSNKDVVKFHHVYNNLLIDELISSNNEIIKSELITTTDSVFFESQKIITEIQEFTNETKTINGFKCFKVVEYYFDLDEPPGLNNLLNINELWVTDQIKSKFHPLIKEPEIIDKYYPLEIKHSIKNVEGMFTLYEISEFTLK